MMRIHMEINRISATCFVFSTLCVISSLCAIPSLASAQEARGLYMNGQWDIACAKCWPSPRTDKNNHCKPSDCAIQGYYHCKLQNPPLAIDDDQRLIALIKSGGCEYAPMEGLNADETNYLKS